MIKPASTASSTDTSLNAGFRQNGRNSKRYKRNWNPGVFRSIAQEADTETPSLSPLPLPSNNKDDDAGELEDEYEVESSNGNRDDVVASLLSNDGISSIEPIASTPSGTSAERWKRRKQIAAGLVASIAVMVGIAKTGLLGTYSNDMIARDAFVTGLTSVLAVVLNRIITWGYENGKYDSKTARKITHITSAPLFIVTWPLFSEASGARFFAGLVTLTNIYRLYLAGSGDAAESSLVKTISRSGDKSEVLGGPFIYVCLFQFFILAFWRDTFPGVVAMTTMAAGDGMADIIGRRYGRNGYKWPFGDGEKSLVGTVAFAVSAFGVSLGICYFLIAAGALSSSLTLASMATRILVISCICAMVEVLPIGDDNYTVPGSAALLSALWLR